MPIKKRATIAIIVAAFLLVFPVGAWAEIVPLTDIEMDDIYAKGIFVDFNINVTMPRGSDLNMPGFKVPFPDMFNKRGNSFHGGSGSIDIIPVGKTATNSIHPGSTNNNGSAKGHPVEASTGSTTPTNSRGPEPVVSTTINTNPSNRNGSNQDMPVVAADTAPVRGNGSANNTIVMPTTSAVSVGNSSMNDNSGLIITAPGAAVSFQINVAVFNNSILNGDFMQSARSDIRTFSFSFRSFNF